ncbi:MAG: DUF512 domain-containing protein, partial [Gemmatimonadota bacterium]
LSADPPDPDTAGGAVGVVTGTRMAEVMSPVLERLAAATGVRFQTIPVENRLFGPTVTTAGLLAGADIRDAVRAVEGLDRVLIPAEALNDDDLFIDSMPFHELEAAVDARLVPAYRLSQALRR